MKALLLIAGIVLILFGAVMSFGVVVSVLEGTSRYSITTDILGLVIWGIGPLLGGLFLCRRALSRRGDGQATGGKVANYKRSRVIIGILLILFGAAVFFGAVMGVLEGAPQDSITSDIILSVVFGIGPIVAGLLLCRRARSQCGDGQATVSKVADDEPKRE